MPQISKDVSEMTISDLAVPALYQPEVVGVGEVTYPPGGTLGPRTQMFVQLVMVLHGSMTVWVDDEPIHALANSVTLLLPYHQEYFEFATKQETEHRWLHLKLSESDTLAPLRRSMPLSRHMLELTESALAVYRSTMPTNIESLTTLGLQMLYLYIGEAQQNVSPKSDVVSIACAFIQENLAADISLDDIARASNISQTHLIRLFRTTLNMTPVAYLWQQRTRQGISLLQQTGLSVGEIAYQSGFKTSYHFARRIKQHTGATPTEIREAAWQTPGS